MSSPVPAASSSKPDWSALLQGLIPFLLPWLLGQLQPGGEAPGPPPPPPPRPNPEPDLEDIDPPGPEPVPAPAPPGVGEGRLDILGFIHQPGGRIYWPDKTVDLDGNVIEAGGREFWNRFNGVTPLNVRTKIMVSPTFHSPGGRELDRSDWERLGWRTWGVKYHARLANDPSNDESVTSTIEGFFHGAGEDQLVAEPETDAFNMGGSRYRETKGDSGTYNVFLEGLLTVWAEMPTGHRTPPRNFVVR